MERQEVAGPQCPLQSTPPMTSLPSTRPHLLKVPPLPNSTSVGTQPPTHGLCHSSDQTLTGFSQTLVSPIASRWVTLEGTELQ
jgi:hypothetical protein